MEMTPFVATITYILALGTIALQIFAAFIVVALVTKSEGVLTFLAEHFYRFGLFFTLSSVLASLFYSDIVGFPPCELCWFQRMFIYPQAVIFALAWWREKKDGAATRALLVYQSLALSLIGLAIAIYHNIGQFIPSVLPDCSATGVSCSMLYFKLFGYIDIPMMSLTTFVVLTLCGIVALRKIPRS